MSVQTCTIGYPRIGPNREMKTALERYWKQQISESELLATAEQIQSDAWKAQKAAGINLVGLDGTLYDQVLDMCWTLGLVPPRFQHLSGYECYFAMARGKDKSPALDMSKYLNTNYHYLVPEISDATQPALNAEQLLSKIQRGQAAIGTSAAVPMLVGPVTMARLASLTNTDVPTVVDKLIPVYSDLLGKISALGVPEVQMLEPALCFFDASDFQGEYERAYQELGARVPINLVTFYDDLGDAYPWVIKLPVAAVSIDFCGVVGSATPCRSLQLLQKHGFPEDKQLGAGIIDGRNVWADDGQAQALLCAIKAACKAPIAVQSSCSLQHVPLDLSRENKLAPEVKRKLAFALQKLDEMVKVAAGTLTERSAAAEPSQGTPISRQTIAPEMFNRPAEYPSRREAQFKENPQIPIFPTTTIGSFPQTKAIRKARADLKAGRITAQQHQELMDQFIAHVIGVQEGLGLDVLVHGEPERSDMVEYFAALLDGFAFTEHAWVQSYGSRYVRPPIIYGDVTRPAPMTVREYLVAQALTPLPVKGMLTGPVTMLNWSFVRNDVPRSTTAFQLALALRGEVADLEKAGCSIIQVDEPALREGLPLKREQWDSYLEWAVDAFRLTCAVAAPGTQIVTHLCYSEFEDILPSIDRMDADVLTIENSRSGNAMITALHKAGYSRDIGAGVYDVHSPVVPPVTFLTEKISSFVATGILNRDPKRIWVNPDCGLKTREWKEVLPSLRQMVQAASIMRAAYDETPKETFSIEEMNSAIRTRCACCN